ncbi:hypothetical protein EXIGLDRAFT_760648 [Exidia glandulosa HHB12029]|uniref:Fungal N-terminal domain-containing protein n=1 Tax=Exidia glandulosa HHB12029 TaxID=1314781 RepID=A0A166BJU4_EXIGL|nr:hypothetical protein EXIGLDRAFT_760648 [Exidia glandulosa HHB12029]
MPVVAFTIGSFGDILAVLQLAWQIRQSLSDAAAASEEIQTLIADIDSFRHALDSAHSTLKHAPHVPQSVHNGVVHIMRVCTTLLRQVQAKVSVRQKELVKKHGARIWRGVWAACAWEILGGKGDVDKMKRRLMEQTAALQTLLSVLQTAALVQIDKRAVEDRATMTRMLQLLEALPAMMKFDEVTVPFLFFLPNPESVRSGVAPMTRMTLEQFLAVIRLSLMCQRDRGSAESDGYEYSLVPRNELRLM